MVLKWEKGVEKCHWSFKFLIFHLFFFARVCGVCVCVCMCVIEVQKLHAWTQSHPPRNTMGSSGAWELALGTDELQAWELTRKTCCTAVSFLQSQTEISGSTTKFINITFSLLLHLYKRDVVNLCTQRNILWPSSPTVTYMRKLKRNQVYYFLWNRFFQSSD
jgi:hypothetical protein